MPSWASGLISLAILLITLLGTIFADILKNKNFNSLFQNNKLPNYSQNTYNSLLANITKIPVIRDLPIYLFWGSVGTLIYFIAKKIIISFLNLEHTKESLSYTNEQPKDILSTYFESLFLRIIGIIFIVGLSILLIKLIIPKLIYDSKMTISLVSTDNIFKVLVYSVLLILAINLETVGLRLLFLRYRLFNSVNEEIIQDKNNF